MHKITIALLDQNKDHIEVTRKNLQERRREFSIQYFTSLDELISSLENDQIDVLVSEYHFNPSLPPNL